MGVGSAPLEARGQGALGGTGALSNPKAWGLDLNPCFGFIFWVLWGIPNPGSQDFLLISHFSKTSKVLCTAGSWNFLPPLWVCAVGGQGYEAPSVPQWETMPVVMSPAQPSMAA